MKKTCCFFGHRKVVDEESVKARLYETIEKLIISEKAEVFLFGSKSDFDKICLEVVTDMKEKYPHIHRIYVRAEYPVISDEHREYLLKHYEDTYYPNRAVNVGKAVYVERNYEMIERSDICVVYYSENYLPPARKNSKRDLFAYQPKSGTKIAYEYAVKKNKNVINMYT